MGPSHTCDAKTETRALPEKKKTALAKPEKQKFIQAEAPASIAKALNMKAAESETTVRNIILKGLQAIGIEAPEHELRDRRK